MRLFIYLLILAVTAYLSMFYGNQALYALLFTELAVPLISLLLGVIGVCTAKVFVSQPKTAAVKGKKSPIVIELSSPLPLSAVSGKLSLTNNLTLSSSLMEFEFPKGFGKALHINLPAEQKENGCIRLKLKKLRCRDMTGIFPLPLRGGKKLSELYVLPTGTMPIEDKGSPLLRSRILLDDADNKGDNRSETYEIRNYLPGDRMSSIHWKQSAKIGELMVKLPGSEKAASSVIFVDVSTGREAERALDDLSRVCDALIRKQKEFAVYWIDHEQLHCSEVHKASDYFIMSRAFILSDFFENDTAASCVSKLKSGDGDFYYIDREGYHKNL